MDFYILTLFPDFFHAFANTSIIKKGLEKKAFTINIKNIRENAINNYGQVDDAPYGGGPGMILRPEPIFKTYQSLNLSKKNKKVIYFTPKGKKINHNYIINLTKYENIVLICGHYEGVDQRVISTLVDDELSIGDFVITGGETPAMVLIDAIVRHLSGVINKQSLNEESFSNNLLEYRQYTRPTEYMGLKVPEVLLSGNHKKIENFRLDDSIRETLKKRIDLIENNHFDKKTEKIIEKIKEEMDYECN